MLSCIITSPKTLITGATASYLECKSQWITGTNSDGSWTLTKLNSPTNTYGNRRDPMKFTLDTFKIGEPIIIWDSLKNKEFSGYSSNKILSMESNGRMRATSYSNFNIPYSHVTSPPTNLSQFTNDVGFITGITWSAVTGKPTFATVATSGLYSDLIGTPSIPSGQVNGDWSSSSGLSEILNKPSLFSGVYSDLSGKPTLFSGVYSDLTGKPTLFSGDYIDLTNKPTIPVINGTGFVKVSGTTISYDNNTYLTTEIDGSISNELQTITAGVSMSVAISSNNYTVINTAPDQVVSITTVGGNIVSGTYPNFTITRKRQETYSGTSNGSGNYTVSFGVSYSVAPNIQANVVGGTTEQQCRIVSISTTGFVVNVFQRATVLSLALSTATTAVSGADIDVLVTEK